MIKAHMVVLDMLGEGKLVVLVCRLKSQDVVLPQHVVDTHKSEHIMLEIGLNTAIPMPDLEVNEQGISATLSFSGRPHYVSLPWACVAVISDSCQRNQGYVFDGQGGWQHTTLWATEASEAPAPTKPKRPPLRLIQGGKS